MTDVCTARPTCGREVAPTELTCPVCLSHARNDLAQIVALAALMPTEAQHAGINSEAAYLALPSAHPNFWFDRRAEVMAGSLCRCPIGACPDLRDPIGPLCLCWQGPTRLMHQSCAWILGPRCPSKREWLAANVDDGGPEWVLGVWELMLREDYGLPSDRPITVSSAAGFLDGILYRFANDPEQDFALFSREVKSCRTHLEAVLHDSRIPDLGAPCPECEAPAKRLRKEWSHWCLDEDCRNPVHDPVGKHDRWVCPTDPDHWWSDEDYRKRVADVYLDNASALTLSEMERRTGVPGRTLRHWAYHGTIKPCGKRHDGKAMYAVTDVEALRSGTIAN